MIAKLIIKTIVSTVVSFGLMLSVAHAATPRTDMVDISNHNGVLTVEQYTIMRNKYDVKAVTVKVSEGTFFIDQCAKGNIANAKAAGLYVNGYHYIHATTTDQAKAEAAYATNAAKNAGLDSNAVLAVDIENSNQMSIGRGMQPIALMFGSEVMRLGGYRSTTYTMGSHTEVSPDNEKAWIASYPYTPSATQNWYYSEHGWQWYSKFVFEGVAGYVDVTQLYDNFFLGGGNEPQPTPQPVHTQTGSLNNVYVLDEWFNYYGRWYIRNYDMSIAPADYHNDIPAFPVTLTDRYGNVLANQNGLGNNGVMEFFILNGDYPITYDDGYSVCLTIDNEPVWLKRVYVIIE